MECRSAKEIINDTEKGASELALEAAESLGALDEEEAEEYAAALIKNRRAMTSLINLANQVLTSIKKGEDHRWASKRFKGRLKRAKDKVVKEAKGVIEKDSISHIATLSYSSTVVETLKAADEVTVFESRPKREGRKTAETISKYTIVHYWIDAAVVKGLDGADAVMVGADTVTEDLFINKIGTYPLVLSADLENVPVYVLADTSKFLPKGLEVKEKEKHGPEEVWSSDSEYIKVHNDYFESVPLDNRFEIYLVTEQGMIKGDKAKELTREKDVAIPLMEGNTTEKAYGKRDNTKS